MKATSASLLTISGVPGDLAQRRIARLRDGDPIPLVAEAGTLDVLVDAAQWRARHVQCATPTASHSAWVASCSR